MTGPIVRALSFASALVVLFAVPLHAATSIWDGGGADDNWTTNANWLDIFGGPGVAPPPNGNNDIVFPASGGLVQTPIVNVPYSINSMLFSNGNGRFVILGVAELTIGAGGVTNNDADIQSVIGPVKLSASQTWNAAAGPLQLDTVNLNGFGLTLSGAHPIDLPGLVAGSGGLTSADSYTSTVTMSGAGSNTYAGLTNVQGGTLTLQKGGVAVPGDLTIGSGATVLLAANEQISQAAGNQVGVDGGTWNLNGYTETIDQLVVTSGLVTTGVGGMLKVGQTLEVSVNSLVNGNLSLGDVTTLVQSGGRVVTGSSLLIGDAANGTLDIATGGMVSSGSSWIAYLPGSTGAVTVSGAGSTWSNAGFLGIGENGMGTLAVTMGGRVSNTHATVGQDGSGTALVAGPGSTWTNTGFLEVANNGTGTMTIENGGVVSDTDGFIGRGFGSSGTVLVSGIDSTWTNTGQLYVGDVGMGILNIEAGGKVAVMGGANVNALSEINVSGGTFDANGTVTIDGGSLMADAGAVVEIGLGVMRNGATITVQNQSELTENGALYLQSGAVMQVNSGANYNTSFTIVGYAPGPAAELIVDGEGTLVTSASCCIDVGYGGTGMMTVTGGARVVSPTGAVGSFDPGSIGTLTLDGTDESGNPSSWTITQLNMALNATSQGTASILNGGLLDAGDLNVGTPGTAWVFVHGTDGAGNPSVLDVGAVTIGSGPYGNGSGEVTASSGGRIEAGNVYLAPTGGTATLTVSDSDSALVQGGASTIKVGHATDGSAAINVRNNARFTTGTGAIDVYATGEINLESGAVFDAHGPINLNGGEFNFLGGTLHVDAFNGNLLNQGGTLAPGHSVGATAISGNYTQLAAAALEIEIGNILPGEWDMLTVAGNAILDGTIEVVLINGFQPVLGNSFTILTTTFGNVGGQFETELLPIVAGLTFDVVYNPQSVVLQVIEAPQLVGDYNLNGVVDAADFTLWRDHLGQIFTLTGENPSAATPGVVDAEDYDFWKQNFGQTIGSGSGATSSGVSNPTVPESTNLMVLILTLVGIIWSRHRLASRATRLVNT